ncbi:Ira2p [Rhizophagus irregularis DAOM 197198w]|uniref:Ira2p n=1 Tax=Rhizophagus irregularis (strain DAOM 197198w) TaxID=1432141 RepID=A0A015KZU0_RHIIW|nr:Ira2p [Rhizophagus irregularis DAOM 197198w]
MNGDTKLILSLINRISLKLPVHSGKKLETLESDPLILQIVNSIIDLSRFKLSTIANNLTHLLETISKSSAMMLEEFVPFEVLQSQLFILKILSACMTSHWKYYRTMKRERELEQQLQSNDDTSSISTLVNQNQQNQNQQNQNQQNQNYQNQNYQNQQGQSSQSNHSKQFKLPRSWDDPPPLEDSLAKYILSVLSRFLHQMASQEDNATGQPPNGNPAGPGSPNNFPATAQGSSATFEIINDIYRNAGRVIFYISASNWNVVFSRIRNRIGYLTSTNDEWPETSELKLLECSDLNSKRLSMVLQELCSSFLHLKRSAQTMMANVLRKAIWNWIEVFPAEFVTLCQEQKRLEGGAEILFDYCSSLAESNPKKKSVFWPLQTMLLILCPDILFNASMSDVSNSMSKKVAFLDSLKQSLRRSKLAEVAAVCYVDICKASTYVAKSDSSALLQIVPDIENDLKAKLFDPNKPFMTESQIDQKLMTDCLTALFRLNQDTLESLIPICLSENAPNAFKLVLVKSCYAIASEENRFPWNPSLSSVYSVLAVPLRQLLHQYINSKDKSNDSRKRRYKPDELNEKTEIILNIIKLYKSDPMLALAYYDPNQCPEEIRQVICGIALCVNDNAIRSIAADTLLELHNLEYIERWGPEDKIMYSFWSISSQVMLAIARQILDYKEREESTKHLLDLLLQLFIRRNQFLKKHKEESTVGINAPERFSCNVVLEIALLVLLCSPDPDICSMSLNCFGHFCQEAQFTTELVPDEMDVQTAPPIVENMEIYLELSASPYVVLGRMAQQKRIRKLLRLMKVATPGNLASWEEAYKRWKNLTQLIARPADEQAIESNKIKGMPWNNPGKVGNNVVIVPEAQNTEWLNYTGFLSSLGGVCVNERPNESLVNDSDNRNNIPQGSNYHLMVEKYVHEMVDLLVCDSAYVRESVRETLGNELNTRLYVILFKYLESIVSRFFDPDGEATPTERYTLFVEQAISVLKLILERIQDASENLYTVDLGGLVLSFARYLNRLGSGQVALRIKKRMCQLAEILMHKKDYVTLRQEIKLRNRLLEIFIEWTSDFTMKADSQGNSETSSNKSEKLHRDLDQTCLKTVVALLHQLPLQPSDAVHESDLSGVKSRLFYKYFSFFIKLLNRCRILEAIDSGTHSAKNNQDLQMLLSKDLGPLKDYTILALSNLLSANVDSGLKYSLSMGYHEDTKTRTAFMQVLTNILNQGTEFEGLAENAMKDRYEKLVELVTESDLNIALSLCEVCPVSDIDIVSKTLLAVFDSRNKTMPLLKAIVEKEVINTEYESDLFRRNCMATRMLASFAKTHGTEYLRETLQPLLNDLLSKPSDFSCELNPDNLLPGEDVNKNLQNLKATAQAFLDTICASGPNMPRTFREVCHYIGSAVEEKYKRAKCVTVGAFVFLRFFNPAIVSPDSDNICKPIENVKIRRALLLITKVIQNLANNVLFGAKEPFMIVLNDFLNNNIVKVTTFLEEISKLPYVPPFADVQSGDNNIVRRLEDSERKNLHRHLVEYQEKMAKDLQTRRVKSINPAAPANVMLDQAQASKKAWDTISKLLAQLGPPTESQKKEFLNIRNNHFETNHQLFKEFMTRNKFRNLESIVSKGVFYEGGFSKERRRVFYLILRRLDAEATDMELLMYHVLNTIEPYMGQPYELLVDVTMFGAANEIQLQWAQQFMHILPFDAMENLSALYFYNTNTAFKKFTKKILLARLFSSKITRRTIFLCNLSELHEHISSPEVRLPKSTTQLDTDPNVVFNPITRISHYRMQVPVTMKISHETIQVLTTKRQDLFNGLSSQLNDVFHISEIEDIAPSSHKSDDNEFIIKQDRGRPPLSFTSPRRDSIMQAIRASKARYQIAKPTNITERVIRPSDVPGTLLNMALLNIGSDDPNLRLAAYNLLVALSLIFNFDVGGQLLGAKGLCIPANNTSFVVGLSERLASLVPQLTPDFLCEFFVGFDKSSTPLKHLCLQYMAPWLNNLAQFTKSGADGHKNVDKTREIIKNLIELTTKETEMYTAVQSKIWSTLGKVDEITNIIIDEFVQYAVDHGISSPQSEIVANTIVTLSSVNIRGKIIAKLRKVIARTSLKATRTLTDNPAWPEIAVLIRFNLMLSFNSRNVQLYLPELFYIISILVATGPPLIRASIHGLIVNLVQSLCTSMPLNEINVKRLTLLLTELSEPNFRYFFGLNNVPGNAFVISSESTHDLPDTMPLASLEKIVQALLEVMVCGAGSVDMSNTWRARWMGLVASTAFQHNPAVQPRAFVTLGCLAREEVDDDLLYQILVALRGALSMFTENDCSLIISIVMCLTNIVENLPADCRYLQSLFWLAMALVQISHIPVFPSAINLLNVVLKALDVNGFFAVEDIATVLLRARVPLEPIAINMDSEAGINYEHFSFAVSATLLKGLKNPVTKTGTKDVLNAFLDIASKGITRDQPHNLIDSSMLGYLAALLPVSAKNADMKELLWVCGIVDSEVDNSELGTTYYKIFEKLDIPDNQTALLLISLMVAMLQTAEHEPERLFLYGFLAEAASALPEVFALVYDSLLPKMTQIINNSETIPILDSVQSILYTVISSDLSSGRGVVRPNQLNQMPSYLEEIGFTNLMDCGSFLTVTKEKMKTNASLASELVNKIISG